MKIIRYNAAVKVSGLPSFSSIFFSFRGMTIIYHLIEDAW
jgi:hypothetical protein